MTDLNQGTQNLNLVVGNGAFNDIDGSVKAVATQDVGSDHDSFGRGFFPFGGGDQNVGTQNVNLIAANGVGNEIDGSVKAIAHQDIGSDHDFFGRGAFPFGGDANGGAQNLNLIAANGVGNDVDGGIKAVATQDIGSDHDGFGLGRAFPFAAGGDLNVGTQNLNLVAGNGAFNDIDGSVKAVAHQDIGSSHDLPHIDLAHFAG